MEKFIPVVVIKEIGETDKILTALKGVGNNTAEITFRTACAAEAIEFNIAASALKHTVQGDYNRVCVAEVEKLACGDGS